MTKFDWVKLLYACCCNFSCEISFLLDFGPYLCRTIHWLHHQMYPFLSRFKMVISLFRVSFLTCPKLGGVGEENRRWCSNVFIWTCDSMDCWDVGLSSKQGFNGSHRKHWLIWARSGIHEFYSNGWALFSPMITDLNGIHASLDNTLVYQ